MNYPTSVLKNALTRIEEIREKNKKNYENKKQEIYRKIPELYSVNSEISQLLKSAVGNTFDKDELKGRLVSVTEKRKKLLLANGYDENALEGVFDCSVCKDEGFVNGQICDCYARIMCREAYKLSNLEEKIKTQNFDNFNMDVFSNKEEMNKIYNYAFNYCKDVPTVKKNLLFSGNQGTGKTFLSSCIAKYFLDNNKSVLYLTAQKLCNILDDKRFGKDTSYDVSDYYDFILNCDLLIIDDLGVEFSGTTSQPMLFDILETRTSNNKKNVISTNLDMKDLAVKYSLRFTSRIFEDYQILIFNGEDLRMKKSCINL